MINPYQSPENPPTEEADPSGRIWLVYHRIFASMFLAIVAAVIVVVSYRILEFEKWPTGHEVRLWLLLVFGLVLIGFCWTPLIRRFRNAASVVQYAYGVVGTVFLAIVCSALALEIFMAWYSGVEIQEFLLPNRANGGYAWLYWLVLVAQMMLCVLPIAICLHGVVRRRWLVVPVLLFCSAVAVLNLRGIYMMDHLGVVPSSWSHFFWGLWQPLVTTASSR